MRTFEETKVAVKFKITYDDGGSYTFSKIKLTAADDAIYNTAFGISSLMERPMEAIYKLTDSEMGYVEEA